MISSMQSISKTHYELKSPSGTLMDKKDKLYILLDMLSQNSIDGYIEEVIIEHCGDEVFEIHREKIAFQEK